MLNNKRTDAILDIDSDDMDDQCIDEQDVIHPENDDWEDEEE